MQENWEMFWDKALDKNPKSTTDLAWFAGLFDGEGSIGIYDNGGKGRGGNRTWLLIQIGMLHAATIKRVKEMWGFGSIGAYKREGRERLVWKWQTKADQALIVLEEIHPYLFTKKAEAELAIEFQKKRQQSRRMWPSKHYPRCVRIEEARLAALLKEAKGSS